LYIIGRNTVSNNLIRISTYQSHLHNEPIYKPPITKIEGSFVYFADNTKLHADYIIHCTGYNISLPMLTNSLQSKLNLTYQPYSKMDLYHYTFSPYLNNLAFIGFAPVDVRYMEGSLHRIFEYQAKWVANIFSRKSDLPEESIMQSQIEHYNSK